MRAALEVAARRNRELERLRQLAAAMLAGRARDELARDVAQAAADLLDSQAASVAFLVEEGRFLRVAASVGALEPTVGMLIPVDGSLFGWVVTSGEPALSDRLDDDPRSWKAPVLPVPLTTAAVVPLRSAGVVIGVVSVYNRNDGTRFSAADVELLETLGDQVVVGLDRALMLEASRRNEEQLAAKNLELQRATRLKSEFLANMSHELRTPLNAIIGFSDLLLQNELGPLAAPQREFLESILRNGHHLLGLINSVLDLSKIEAGRMTLDLTTTDVREAITSAVTDTAALRADKRHRCTLKLDAASLTIVADPTRVRQVLYNLLSNASKFTPPGGELTLTAIRTRAPLPLPAERAGEQPKLETRAAVWVSVVDTGIGIAAEDMPKLFQEFSQVESGPDRPQQGTGLGLALCRTFIEMHGGAIGAESIPGRGSTPSGSSFRWMGRFGECRFRPCPARGRSVSRRSSWPCSCWAAAGACRCSTGSSSTSSRAPFPRERRCWRTTRFRSTAPPTTSPPDSRPAASRRSPKGRCTTPPRQAPARPSLRPTHRARTSPIRSPVPAHHPFAPDPSATEAALPP